MLSLLDEVRSGSNILEVLSRQPTDLALLDLGGSYLRELRHF
jgi:hypothetical protein